MQADTLYIAISMCSIKRIRGIRKSQFIRIRIYYTYCLPVLAILQVLRCNWLQHLWQKYTIYNIHYYYYYIIQTDCLYTKRIDT